VKGHFYNLWSQHVRRNVADVQGEVMSEVSAFGLHWTLLLASFSFFQFLPPQRTLNEKLNEEREDEEAN
jgi:hypothetical protein